MIYRNINYFFIFFYYPLNITVELLNNIFSLPLCRFSAFCENKEYTVTEMYTIQMFIVLYCTTVY